MNSSARRLLVLTLLLFPQCMEAQNLVPNGSFEDYVVCPGGYSQSPAEFRVNGWRALTMGSPDYFNSCSGGEAAVPYNWAGISDAYDGYGYAGIYTWMALGKEYREYLHCKLHQPLLRDSVYRVEFRYKLSSYSKYAIDRIALLLSDSLETFRHHKPLKMAPSISFLKDSALTPETGAWELASAEYRARGGEQFLTIGNFTDNESTGEYYIRFRPASEPMLANSAYYYIDDVRVIPQFAEPGADETLPVFTGADSELNRIYVLKNIQFDLDSYALLPQSYYDLDKLVKYLEDNPDVRVEISGHTDDTGEENYNERLSEERAKSAASYLKAKGIPAARISTSGYGERMPVVHDQSEKAREANRRVEIRFHR